MDYCGADSIFAGTLYGAWNCKRLLFGAGDGADQSCDRILHGAQQCMGCENRMICLLTKPQWKYMI